MWLFPAVLTSLCVYYLYTNGAIEYFRNDGKITTLITVDNFNLQSDFKILDIYPYNNITRDNFEKWINQQFDISFNNILKNIASQALDNGLIQQNVSSGVVIASPSKNNPNYYFQWIRDGAITINSVVNHVFETENLQNPYLPQIIEEYINNTYNLQRIDNLSGKFGDNFKNLGEPKFLVNSTTFNENWGRPQNDGPPLRCLTIANFIESSSKHDKFHDLFDFKSTYEDIIKVDLQYIINFWNSPSFDLWEEINSFHFFTSLVQLKALKTGKRLFELFDDQDEDFGIKISNTYDQLLEFIYVKSGFVNYSLKHIVETPSILNERVGLDIAVVIASLLTHDELDLSEEFSVPFNVDDFMILNTLSELVKTMKYLYPINHDRISLHLGVALGRYPEDVYDGNGVSEGNPWFLTTIAASELLFKLIRTLYFNKADLVIDSNNQYFYLNHIIEANNLSLWNSNVSLNIPYNSLAFNQTISNIFAFGDSFLDVVREHVSDQGEMNEQFNKYTGFMQGATDLTWSYGSFWNAYRWRQEALKTMGGL